VTAHILSAGEGDRAELRQQLLRAGLGTVLICGLLDTTAVLNTATFGIGAYVLAGAVLASLLLRRSERTYIPAPQLAFATLLLGIFWLSAALQSWRPLSLSEVTLTQTVLRTILVGHFGVCAAALATVDEPTLVRRTVTTFLFVYIYYGLYDFVAQVFELPRFLDFLRNSASFAIMQNMGAQGWIQLPRLASLSSEPSHTVMPVALAFYLATRLRGWTRFALILGSFLFCVGTFSRTLWLVIGGAGAFTGVLGVLSSSSRPGLRALTRPVLVAAGVALPAMVSLSSAFLSFGADADVSTLERWDSSRIGLWLFASNPLIGVGFHGWEGMGFQFAERLALSSAVVDIHNGVSAYLAALGVLGAVVIYAPIALLLRARALSNTGRAWWLATYCLTLVGGDYISLASTWTVLAVATYLKTDQALR
jgi:O-Antigen ligase